MENDSNPYNNYTYLGMKMQLPNYKSRLIISDVFLVMSERSCPNAWRRLWYWILLGWRWKKI